MRVGTPLLGRVINGLGEPIDGRGPLTDTSPRPLDPPPMDPLNRPLIDTPLATGVRAIDAMTPLGRGQRVGIFAAPGVGKSTLLASCVKHTAADVAVIALIGERGREVRHFIENALGERGMARSVVVYATSDEPALLRIRAARVACCVAESFRDRGNDVLLVMDSVTRYCQAQRQVGLAAGEPPATKGYPPSVFAQLPVLLERAGRTERGSITGLYSGAGRGRGHERADRRRLPRDPRRPHPARPQASPSRATTPAIDVPGSISRVADDVTDGGHRNARREVLKLITAYRRVEDLVNIGAYAAGSNPEFDLAIAAKDVIDRLLSRAVAKIPGRGRLSRRPPSWRPWRGSLSRPACNSTNSSPAVRRCGRRNCCSDGSDENRER